jgi:hypothetical protein
MKQEEFDELYKTAQSRRETTLLCKSIEYATKADRLHNFKQAAHLCQNTPEMALWGMLIKHVVALNDMVNNTFMGHQHPMENWLERLDDVRNYLDLLEAVVREEAEKDTREPNLSINR